MIPGAADRLEARNAATNRVLVLIALLALFVVVVTGITTVSLQVIENRKAQTDRDQLKAIGQEIQDCTTPANAASDCQRRQADAQRPVLRALSEDNLRASIAVGACLREQAPDVEACALTKFRAALDAAEKRKPPPTDPKETR